MVLRTNETIALVWCKIGLFQKGVTQTVYEFFYRLATIVIYMKSFAIWLCILSFWKIQERKQTQKELQEIFWENSKITPAKL